MNAKAANKFYEVNKRYVADKITILDLALAALEDAIRDAYERGALEGTDYDLNDFRERQAHLVFEDVMKMGSLQIDEISQF